MKDIYSERRLLKWTAALPWKPLKVEYAGISFKKETELYTSSDTGQTCGPLHSLICVFFSFL